jgi:hypothetical protein
MQVSRKRTETEIHTLIRIITRLVFDKLNLIDFKLGVGIVEINKNEVNKVQQRTIKVKNSVSIVKPNLWPRIFKPKGINSKYAPAGAGTP